MGKNSSRSIVCVTLKGFSAWSCRRPLDWLRHSLYSFLPPSIVFTANKLLQSNVAFVSFITLSASPPKAIQAEGGVFGGSRLFKSKFGRCAGRGGGAAAAAAVEDELLAEHDLNKFNN